METWLRLWCNACLQFWNNSTGCHWHLELQHHSFVVLFVSWYSCRGDKWENISASFMWKKLMIRLHEFISVGHLYASQAVHVYMWGHSECPGFTAVRAVGQVLRTQTLNIRGCSLVYVKHLTIWISSRLNALIHSLLTFRHRASSI